MSNDDNDENFDLEAMLREGMSEENENWQFELNEEGDLMDMAEVSTGDKLKAIAFALFIHIVEFALLIGVGFVLVWGIVILMNLTGVAVPVQ